MASELSGSSLEHLLISKDRLLRIDAQELSGFGELQGDLVARQPAADRLSGQALTRRSGDQPAGQRGDGHRADDPRRDHLRSARSTLRDLLLAVLDRPQDRRGARRVPVAQGLVVVIVDVAVRARDRGR